MQKGLRDTGLPALQNQADELGNVNVSNFAGRVPGVGGFAAPRLIEIGSLGPPNPWGLQRQYLTPGYRISTK